MDFKYVESKVYKLFLVSRYRPLFGDSEYSDNWDPIINAMYDDLNKVKEFEFYHPQNINKRFFRKYVHIPVNGNTFMMVGQLRREMDSAGVKIVLNSENYKESYLVVFDYKRSFRNPDLLVEMIVNAINRALKNSDVEVGYILWDDKEVEKMWPADYLTSYTEQYKKTGGKVIPNIGFEDMLAHDKKVKAKKEMRKQEDDLQLSFNFFFMQNADVNVNSAGNTIARTILSNKE